MCVIFLLTTALKLWSSRRYQSSFEDQLVGIILQISQQITRTHTHTHKTQHNSVRCTYFFSFLSRGINIVNWITMTRKSGKHLRMTYGNTGQLFWPYLGLISSVYRNLHHWRSNPVISNQIKQWVICINLSFVLLKSLIFVKKFLSLSAETTK